MALTLTSAPAASTSEATTAERLERLPLTCALWRLGIVTPAGWALAIPAHGPAARIYPFIWGPQGQTVLEEVVRSIELDCRHSVMGRRNR